MKVHAPLSSITMNTSLRPNFPTMVVRFSGQIPETLHLDFMFSLFKDFCKALSTRVVSVVQDSCLLPWHNRFYLKRCFEWFEAGVNI
jgi:hypothetical protein